MFTLRREADFAGLLVENHLADLIARGIEFFHRRRDRLHRLIRRGQGFGLDGRLILREGQGRDGGNEDEEAETHLSGG